MLQFVKSDLFNIAERLKRVNRDYHLFWNNMLMRYEVHNRLNSPGNASLCFVVPYGVLDERTIEYAHKTKIENFDLLENDFQNHNKEIKDSARKNLARSALLLGDMMDYAAGVIHEVVFRKGSKWF